MVDLRSPRDRSIATTSQARLREPHVLAAQAYALSSPARGTSEFDRGACDALHWLLRGGPGPMTGSPTDLPITGCAIVRELGAAEACIWGESPHYPAPQYARGAEHALMWAEYVTPAPPVSAGSASSVAW